MPAGKGFLDTNIFAYAFDQRDPRKHRLAVDLIVMLLRERRGVLSFQVIQEFLNVAVRGSVPGLNVDEGRRYLHEVVAKLDLLVPSFALFERGLHIQARYKLPWYDSLIVAAALEAGCEAVYTEDLQHGQAIEGMTIINPFF